jgi:hypothetical protein
VEADPTAIAENKVEIEKALKRCPISVIIFVFGNMGGRIRDDDVVAFNALHGACNLKMDSLLLVMNGLDQQPPEYEEKCTVLFNKCLKLPIPPNRMCFLERVNDKSGPVKEILQKKVLAVLASLQEHNRSQEISLILDFIQQEKATSAKFQQKYYEAEIAYLKLEIEKANKSIQELKNAPREIHHYHERTRGKCTIM